ncbi:MAG: winged helix DNA-binding domain-containing protein [Candidatus Lokiarchaeota archaeon]|nr:winged helix DNA-binding domain-containing protein [Candidatus Lokiarchaeota archaeon]
MDSIPIERVNHYILAKHHLTDDSKGDKILKITKDLCGLQATGTFEPYLYLFSRKKEFRKEDLDRELYETKSLLKVRGMRNTLFIVPKDDAPILNVATNELKENRFDGFFTHSDFTRKEYNDLESKILEALKKDSLIATDIKKRIGSDRNISIILSLMCDKLLLVRDKPPKGWKDRRNTYTLMKNSFPELDFDYLEEIEAIQSLILKYIKSYGPVTEQDITWWAGLTKTKARRAIESNQPQIERITLSDETYYIYKSDIESLQKLSLRDSPVINFLANLDPYLMGYKNRKRFINDDVYDFVFDRSGNATTTILLNGEVIGIWDFQTKPDPTVKILLFEKLTKEILNVIKKQARLIGEFILEQEVKIQECSNPEPLTKRSAGTFMRPLKNC